MKEFVSGEVRINGAQVFINDKEVASMKPIPPVRQTRKDVSYLHSPAATSGPKNVLKVPYIKQDAHEHCGRASGAMVKRYFHPDAKIGSTYRDGKGRIHQSLMPLSADSVASSTGRNYQYSTVNNLSDVAHSVQAGNPAIIYTDVYRKTHYTGNHIFVLTGYDPTIHPEEGGQFYANNTLGHGPDGDDPVGVTEINNIPLTADSLAKRLYSQKGHNVLYVKPK